MGIAADGGLFVPESIPCLSQDDIRSMVHMNYKERAAKILSLFLTDYIDEELKKCIDLAYSEAKFDTPRIAPLQRLDDDTLCWNYGTVLPVPSRTWHCRFCPISWLVLWKRQEIIRNSHSCGYFR